MTRAAAKASKRRHQRDVQKLGKTMTGNFLELVKLLATEAPPDHPPEIFGVLAATTECLAFLPAFMAQFIETRDQREQHDAQLQALDLVETCWKQAKKELLANLGLSEERAPLGERIQ